jgi:hypothetical protein
MNLIQFGRDESIGLLNRTLHLLTENTTQLYIHAKRPKLLGDAANCGAGLVISQRSRAPKLSMFAKTRACLRLTCLTVLAVIPFLAPVPARADGWIMLSPGSGYRIEWTAAASDHPVIAVPRVARQGLSPLDRWFQVSPGGEAIALWSSSTGLVVFRASGIELLHQKDHVAAFRFSPAGDRIAFASARGIEVLELGQHDPRILGALAGVDWLEWTDVGLVARTLSKLYLVDFAGHQRTLAKLRPGTVVAAAKGRLVYFADGSLLTINLANDGPTSVTKVGEGEPVINAVLSPDGANVLFATARRVYLREGSGPVRMLADARGVQSLFFSPNGAAYLWTTHAGGEVVVEGGGTTALPRGTLSARFSQSRNGVLVVTAEDGVATWDATTGARSLVGGISPDDGVNLAGDITDGNRVVVFYYKKSGYQKEKQRPTSASLP